MGSVKLYEVWRNDGKSAVCVSSFKHRDDAVRYLRAEKTHGYSLRIRSPRGHWLDIGPDYVLPAAQNRRRSARIPHNAYCEVELNPGRYRSDDRGRVLVPIRNVSREGIGLVTPQVDRSLLINDRVLVVLEATQQMYRLPARIAWSTPTDVGIEIADHQSWVRDEFSTWLNRSINS
jgi:hypothetical protein